MSSRKQYFKNIANISIAWWVWPRTIIMYVTVLWLSFVNWISGAIRLKDELTREWTVYGPWQSVTSDKWLWITKVEIARRITLCLWLALCITPLSDFNVGSLNLLTAIQSFTVTMDPMLGIYRFNSWSLGWCQWFIEPFWEVVTDKSGHIKSLVVTSALGRKLISLFLRNVRKF